jgi:beclin 1
MLGVCDRCRGPLVVVADASASGNASAAGASAPLGDSYVVLPERARGSSSGPLPDLSQTLVEGEHRGLLAPASRHEELRTVNRLLELSDVLHDKAPSSACGVPLCQDCASGVLRLLQQQLEDAHEEQKALKEAERDLIAGDDDATVSDGTDPDEAPLSVEEFAREVEAQRAEEEALVAELAAAQREREALAVELERLRSERAAQSLLEEERHAAINAGELERAYAEDETLRASQLVRLCEGELSRLEGVDVLSSVFSVDLGGPIGTINGLRLGRASGVTVEWAELNAALGQVVLAVHTLGHMHLRPASAAEGGSCGFSAYILMPIGSASRIAARDAPSKTFELFSSGQLSSRLFGASRGVERGQLMLLECVAELCRHAASRPPPPHMGGCAREPPVATSEIGSLVGSNSAPEGKKCLALLAWLLSWSRASRSS